jgi:hypothetical protein
MPAGNYSGAPERWLRSAGSGLVLPAPVISKKDLRRMSAAVRPVHREVRQCDYATKVAWLYKKREDPKPGENPVVAIPVPAETCEANAVTTFSENGKTTHRCAEHTRRRSE